MNKNIPYQYTTLPDSLLCQNTQYYYYYYSWLCSSINDCKISAYYIIILILVSSIPRPIARQTLSLRGPEPRRSK